MAAAFLNLVGRSVSLSWLTGPIFDKELRVSSRRARNYALRFAYLIFLATVLVLVWLTAVDYGQSAIYRVSRMARAGKTIVICTVWFQFCATQVVAVVMLSTSLSEELYNRTLGLLMTTPISSFQIVMGKLLSKLLQLILLLAISLPVLAIVRVFGGVPWDYVVSSLCVTLASAVFVGSASLFFSVFTRRAYIAIIVTCLSLGALFMGIPYLSGVVYHAATNEWPGDVLTTALFYHNPFVVLFFNTEAMTSPGSTGGLFNIHWPLHCGIMLGGSILILGVSVVMVRRVALRQAVGEQGLAFRRRRAVKDVESVKSGKKSGPSEIVRVAGSPVIWKELRSPMFGRRRRPALAAVILGMVGLLISYLAVAAAGDLDDSEVHMAYSVIYLGLGLLFSMVLSSTSITSEKESRSWPLLLVTTLDEGQILFGKFIGILRRCLPAWSFLLAHVFLSSLFGLMHPIAIVQIGILVIWVVTFLSGTGLYFSSVYKHTTIAVIANFAFAAAIWAIPPLILEVGGASPDIEAANLDVNPFIHALVIMDSTVGEGGVPNYDWPGTRNMSAAESAVWMLKCAGVYAFLGFLFAWRAKCRLRRNIF